MAMYDQLFNGSAVVASNLMLTIRCANADCNEPVLRCSFCGPATIVVPACPKCGRSTAVRSTADGVTVALVPKEMETGVRVKPTVLRRAGGMAKLNGG